MRCVFVLCAVALVARAQNDCSRNTFRYGRATKSTDEITQEFGAYVFRFVISGRVGTGFLIDPNKGVLLTAAHVIADGGAVLSGEVASIPSEKYKFSRIANLDLCRCRSNCNYVAGRCQAGTGAYTGIDAALLQMDPKDLDTYHARVGDYGRAFDLVLGPDIPDQVYSIGYREEHNTGQSAFLEPLPATSISSPRIEDTDPPQDPLLLWYLTTAVAPGLSGSPLFDGNGRVFGLLLEESKDSHNGIALNLAEIFTRSQSARSQSNPFRSLALRPPASALDQKIKADGYREEREIARDLTPPLVSNRELTSVVLDVFGGGPPLFRFTACLGAAVQQRGLAGLFRYVYPLPAAAPARLRAAYHLQEGQGRYAAGQRKGAEVAFLQAYRAAKQDTGPGKDAAVEMSAALGASRVLLDQNQFSASEVYAQAGLNAANVNSSTAFRALANTYLYQIRAANDPKSPGAVKYARDAFLQSPESIYLYLGDPKKQADLFKNYTKLQTLAWEPYVGVVQDDLERRLLRILKD